MKNTFGIDIIPDNENDRLAELRKFRILNTPPEKSLNQIALVVAKVFNVPISLISFVADEDVYFKGNFGLKSDSASRGVSLCAIAILQDATTVFEDTIEEPCLLANPQVHGEFGLRFYAGAPLRTPDGFNIGTLCIVDFKQRFFSSEQIALLEDFASMVMEVLVMRRIALEGA